ncbi:polysaccharide export protein [Gallaecimonas sp. GXIMD1310]|uniref:polysaccharide export protein n=1 Tax=Gallaecimonas sp. GXIMD1310 TaxID=3131926 RepID=UPI0032536185
MKKLLLLLLWIGLGGCTLVPGAHVPYDTERSWAAPAPEHADLAGTGVAIVPITPQTLAKYATLNLPKPALNTALEAARKQYDYTVGAGDILSITVWDHPELTIPAGSMRSPQDAGNWVHTDGTIFYPYVGVVHVAGLKVTQIRGIIRQRLTRYIENPQVDVTVAAFRSKRVYVTGEVKQPGVLPITNVPLTLLEAVDRTGGLTADADWTDVTLTRAGQEQHFSLRQLFEQGNTQQNVLLQAGDVVHVARNDYAKVFVLGEVGKPQSLTIGRAGMSLAEALSDAGGFSETTANASGIFVLRKAAAASGHNIDVFQLDAANATALVLADQFTLQPRDIVYVTAAPVARWNRVISQLLPSLSGLYSVTRTRSDLTN